MTLTTPQYTALAYVLALGLLLGYAAILWIESKGTR
jgi:hypothetical protein